MDEARCGTCGADWTAGDWTAGCAECGGGALSCVCPVCGGRCGATWTRAVQDSHDAHLAHWVGACRLPPEEQRAALAALVSAERQAVPPVPVRPPPAPGPGTRDAGGQAAPARQSAGGGRGLRARLGRWWRGEGRW